jgi:hypothetical protein
LIKPSNFTNYKIGLNQIGFYLQKFTNKNRKEKRKEKEKEERAPGTDSSPQPKTAHGPFPSLSESLPSPSSSVADTGTHLSSLPGDLNELNSVSGTITARNLRDSDKSLAPFAMQHAYKTPLCSTHLPSQNPSKNRRQAAQVRCRRAATTVRGHRQSLVSRDLLLISSCTFSSNSA